MLSMLTNISSIFTNCFIYLVVLFTISSCENSSILIEEKDIIHYPVISDTNDLRCKIDSVGLLHNLSMDYLYNRFDSIKNELIQQPNDTWFSYVKVVLIEFYSGFGYDVCSSLDTSSFQLDNYIVFSEFVDTVNLSLTAKSIILKGDSARLEFDEGDNLLVLINICDSLISECLKLESDEEALACGSMLSTLKHSANYWLNNMGKFVELGQTNTNKMNEQILAKEKNYHEKKCMEKDAQGALFHGAIRIFSGLAGVYFGSLYGGAAASIKYAFQVQANIDLWWIFGP